ncbi:hypothetical protein ELE36_04510 [Pseudolysobacter antarcticus]|uniref:Uncharacterized protein n=1 Tax=Pseudolysobacter antarcticus TaxID=2511995 RepID=A0A411HGT2_9GAMM|nr:hypothetical protein [Pseudolysobacter antarcticus]QBB69693.1 hypothetical protein ELE36_04510 [Pseudolysobacter antarcticus]
MCTSADCQADRAWPCASALAYPEVFAGALLNAGSDRFGSDILPLPPQTLFQRFEEHTRLVYATGTQDDTNLVTDAHSRDSARALCITDIVITPMRNLGHAPVDAATLDHALSALEMPTAPRTELAERRRQRNEEIRRKLANVQSQTEAGKTDAAMKRLIDVDLAYGGLAAPTSIELAHRLDLQVQPPSHGSATKF